MRCLLLLLSCSMLTPCLPVFVQSNNSLNHPANEKSGPSLDGKIFYIKTHQVSEPDQEMNDTLRFNDGKMMGSGYMLYSFKAASYHASNQNGKIYFTCTCFSDKEGKISWNGVIDDKNISGKYVWRKPGETDVNYVFTGIQK